MPEGIGVQIKPNTSFTLRQNTMQIFAQKSDLQSQQKYIHKLRNNKKLKAKINQNHKTKNTTNS